MLCVSEKCYSIILHFVMGSWLLISLSCVFSLVKQIILELLDAMHLHTDLYFITTKGFFTLELNGYILVHWCCNNL